MAGDSLRLNAGDVVLISLSARADLRVLTAAEAEIGRGRTRIAWSPGLEFTHDGFDEPPDPAVRVMRKRLSRVRAQRRPVERDERAVPQGVHRARSR